MYQTQMKDYKYEIERFIWELYYMMRININRKYKNIKVYNKTKPLIIYIKKNIKNYKYKDIL